MTGTVMLIDIGYIFIARDLGVLNLVRNFRQILTKLFMGVGLGSELKTIIFKDVYLGVQIDKKIFFFLIFQPLYRSYLKTKLHRIFYEERVKEWADV